MNHQKSLLISLIFLLTACTQTSTRPPNQYEQVYTDLATSTNQPEFCAKISPSALNPASAWNPRGRQISLTRSNCYYEYAIRTRNSYLCQYVKPYSTLLLDGSDISPKGCQQQVDLYIESNTQSRTGGTSTSENLPWLLNELGYTDTEILDTLNQNRLQKYTQVDELNIYEFYLQEQPTSRFRTRITNLPDFSNQ